LSRVDADAWVDGGWGVEALVGQQTRAHSDLDIVVPTEGLSVACAALKGAGFMVIRDWLPTAMPFGTPMDEKSICTRLRHG
jgi:lincosamide nucleotidyltransferase A/C/D/E